MNIYDVVSSVNGTPSEIREFDIDKDIEKFGSKENMEIVLKRIKDAGGTGKVLVTDAKIFNVFYAEEENGVYFDLFNCTPEYLDTLNPEKMIGKMREAQKVAIDTNDWHSYFYHLPSQMKMYAFEKVYKKIPGDDVAEVFFELYTEIDHNAACINLDVLDYICEHVKKANSDEVITIYRGEGTKSLPFDKSYSWTTDIDTAIWFASKGVGKAVYEAKVHKSDIIFSTNKRHENEVIVRPEDVYDVRRLSMYPCEDDQFVVACTQKHIEKCKKYVPLLKELYPEDKDGVHDISHVCRVLLFCFMIADEIGLEQRDTELLALAAVYHDCCRTHDGVDTVHGSTSAEKFLNSNDGKYLDREYQSYVYNAIKYHSLDDEVGVEAIWKDKWIGERLRAIRIHDILKDADALDRFRLGRPHSGGGTFEYKYLRRMESKQLVLLAAYLVNMNINKIILQN